MTGFLHLLAAPIRWFVGAPLRSTGFTGLVVAWIGFLSNVGGAQQYACSQSWFRHACAAMRLGGIAGSEEQRFWDQISTAQSCDGYRSYIARYSGGEFVSVANARLGAARRMERETWKDEDRPLPLQVNAPLAGSASPAEARAVSIASARKDAYDLLCKPYSTGEFRLGDVEIKPERWACSSRDGGTACGFEGVAICHVRVRTINVTEDCSVLRKA